jgi:hypothetical protein
VGTSKPVRVRVEASKGRGRDEEAVGDENNWGAWLEGAKIERREWDESHGGGLGEDVEELGNALKIEQKDSR